MIKLFNQILTPKQWAKNMLQNDLDNITDFYYERYSDDWNKMSEVEKQEVRKQIDNYHNRIMKLLKGSNR